MKSFVVKNNTMIVRVIEKMDLMVVVLQERNSPCGKRMGLNNRFMAIVRTLGFI